MRIAMLKFGYTFWDMPTKNTNKAKKMNEDIDALHKEGIVGMMISLHTFPIESEEELEEKKKTIEILKKMEVDNLKAKESKKAEAGMKERARMKEMNRKSTTKQTRHNNK